MDLAKKIQILIAAGVIATGLAAKAYADGRNNNTTVTKTTLVDGTVVTDVYRDGKDYVTKTNSHGTYDSDDENQAKKLTPLQQAKLDLKQENYCLGIDQMVSTLYSYDPEKTSSKTKKEITNTATSLIEKQIEVNGKGTEIISVDEGQKISEIFGLLNKYHLDNWKTHAIEACYFPGSHETCKAEFDTAVRLNRQKALNYCTKNAPPDVFALFEISK